MSQTRIFGGTVVTPAGTAEADVIVRGGGIAGVEPCTSSGDIDARGCLVLPAGIDPHTHPMADVDNVLKMAERGGTTTLLGFTAPRPGEKLVHAHERSRRELGQHFGTSIFLHPAVWEPAAITRATLAALRDAGARSIKLYLAFPELGIAASDRVLYETLRDAAQLDMLVMVHCESPGLIEALVDELIESGRIGPEYFAASRPAEAEEEGVARTLAFARRAGAPVYLVHLSTDHSIQLVRTARKRGQKVYAEACIHHLILDDTSPATSDAAQFLVVPPLRSRNDVDALWSAVADGTITTIGSDHVHRNDEPPAGAVRDFRTLAYGFSGVQARVPLALAEGLRRGISPSRLADLLSTGPARLFGLPRSKGVICPGAGADMIVWDPEADDAGLHRPDEVVQGWPYEGIASRGVLRYVISNGIVGSRPGGPKIGKCPAEIGPTPSFSSR